MAIFLDTSRPEEVERFHRMGIIRGVTTNPTIMLKDGVTGGLKGVRERAKEIADIINPLPLSIEVTTNDKEGMIEQALAFQEWYDHIVIKITIHGPQGELDNVEVIHTLAAEHGIKLNITAMMSAQQCFLAAMAGATYVSLFGGRVNNMGYETCDELKRLRRVLDLHQLPSKIIACSTREILNVIEWLDAGAHVVTVTPNLLQGMLIHPYTKETVQMFLDDAAKGAAMMGE